jgi:hypothetical protein
MIVAATQSASAAREQAASAKSRQSAGQPAKVAVATSDDPFAVLDREEGSEDPIRFLIDERLTAIDYATIEDFVEFHQSLNTVRLTPDHHPIQSGWAAVAAVRQGGAIHVYIALLLLDSCEALVYAPAQQPQRDADYGPVMREALNFVEVAGFMMDCENFQTGGDNYALVLRKKTAA